MSPNDTTASSILMSGLAASKPAMFSFNAFARGLS